LSPRHFEAHPGNGKARFHARDLAIPDFHDFFDSISPDATGVPGHVSFDVRWAGGGARTLRPGRTDHGGRRR
jgi:hypothetical protein